MVLCHKNKYLFNSSKFILEAPVSAIAIIVEGKIKDSTYGSEGPWLQLLFSNCNAEALASVGGMEL